MESHSYILEYELKTSSKVLFPYISTAAGLEDWFADKVKILGQNKFNFIWDGENHPAQLIHVRSNKFAK